LFLEELYRISRMPRNGGEIKRGERGRSVTSGRHA
jgi:hypothetical protein